jgi:hypothetical protein
MIVDVKNKILWVIMNEEIKEMHDNMLNIQTRNLGCIVS